MRNTSRVSGLLWAGLVGAAVAVAGCASESRRGTEGARTRESGVAGTPAPGTTARTSGWTRVPVKRVDLRPTAGNYLLEALASVPSGWRVEIRPLPVTVPSAREFEVVGLAPAIAAGSSPTVVAASLEVALDAQVEQVAVYDEDDATLLTPR